jgi:segregation and condensation protein B
LEDQQLKSANNQPTQSEKQPLPSTDEPRLESIEEQPLQTTEEPKMESREEQPLQQAEVRHVESIDEQPLQQTEDPHVESREEQPLQPTEEPHELKTTENRQLKSAIESLLFIAGNPVSLDRLKDIFEEAAKEQIEAQIDALKQEYEARGSGIMLAEVAGGYQLATRPENAAWIRKFRSVKVSSKLSKPALETLAIVAYKQPITRSEVEAIRGVNIGGIMRNLMERRLVKIVGKKDVPGKPMMYGTSLEFLQYFGLKDLSALPTLKEFQELEAGEEVMEEMIVEGEDAAAPDETEAVTATATKE